MPGWTKAFTAGGFATAIAVVLVLTAEHRRDTKAATNAKPTTVTTTGERRSGNPWTPSPRTNHLPSLDAPADEEPPADRPSSQPRPGGRTAILGQLVAGIDSDVGDVPITEAERTQLEVIESGFQRQEEELDDAVFSGRISASEVMPRYKELRALRNEAIRKLLGEERFQALMAHRNGLAKALIDSDESLLPELRDAGVSDATP